MSGARRATRHRREDDLEAWLRRQLADQREPEAVTCWSDWNEQPSWARSVLTADQAMQAVSRVVVDLGLWPRQVKDERGRVVRIEAVPR